MRWIWFVACVGALGASNATGTIFRCAGADGEVLFTDVECPSGRPQPTHDINVVESIVPDAAQMARAPPARARLPRADSKRAPPASTVRAPRVRASEDASDAARRCEIARDRLDAVHATMRRGYKATSAGRLEARLYDARNRVERECKK